MQRRARRRSAPPSALARPPPPGAAAAASPPSRSSRPSAAERGSPPAGTERGRGSEDPAKREGGRAGLRDPPAAPSRPPPACSPLGDGTPRSFGRPKAPLCLRGMPAPGLQGGPGEVLGGLTHRRPVMPR